MKTFVFLILICIFSVSSVIAQNQPPCSQKEAKQFDFWIGTWDLEWTDAQGKPQKGTNTIRKILNDCVIEENFNGGGSPAYLGKSHSMFDAQSGKWKQTWVDNAGAYLDFTGELADGKMILQREFISEAGKKIMQRMTFYNIQKDSLEWVWESSQDEGKTWKVNWKLNYKRQKSPTEGEKTFKQELDQLRSNMQKQMPKEAWEQGERIGDDMTTAVIARGGMEKVLKVGAKIPDFTMNEAFGNPVSNKSLHLKGSTVFVFYRGAWCPFCNLYLRAIQKKLPEITKLRANLVAVTSAVSDMTFEKTKLNYTVLTDSKNEVSRKFGLVYEVTDKMNAYYKSFGKDLVKEYGTEKPELLMSAVFIVDQQGIIRYLKAEAAYKNWAEPTEILENLRKINTGK